MRRGALFVAGVDDLRNPLGGFRRALSELEGVGLHDPALDRGDTVGGAQLLDRDGFGANLPERW